MNTPENPDRPFDTTSFVMSFEAGECTSDEIIEGFQRLIDNGIIHHLQGHYQRTAQGLIDRGVCHPKGGQS